eukprot:6649049-Pyramimonas_sp.AAC.1
MAEPEASGPGQTGLPSGDQWPHSWVQRKWNATWRCRRCLVYIWNVAFATLDHIMDRDSGDVFPRQPTARSRQSARADPSETAPDLAAPSHRRSRT